MNQSVVVLKLVGGDLKTIHAFNGWFVLFSCRRRGLLLSLYRRVPRDHPSPAAHLTCTASLQLLASQKIVSAATHRRYSPRWSCWLCKQRRARHLLPKMKLRISMIWTCKLFTKFGIFCEKISKTFLFQVTISYIYAFTLIVFIYFISQFEWERTELNTFALKVGSFFSSQNFFYVYRNTNLNGRENKSRAIHTMESLAIDDVCWFERFPEFSRAPETLRRDDSTCEKPTGRPSSSPWMEQGKTV